MKEKLNRLTKNFIIIILAIVVIYDVCVIIKGGTGVSISFVVNNWAKQYPIVPLLVGIVLGHLFWPILIEYKKERGD